jgi:lipid-binding SYLF domain-containing protein
MRRALAVLLALLLASPGAFAKSKEEERLGDCARILGEVLNIPDGIPQDLLDKAECVLVLPVKKGGFIVGVRVGKGAAVCRTGEKFDGPWSPPAMYELSGGSIGFQIGGEATDFILLVMNPNGVKKLLSSKFTLGVDASVAGGPKGRTAEAATDAQLGAEILTYSRTKGLFAGVSLEGSPVSQDSEANKKIYGKPIEARALLLEAAEPAPPAGKPLVDLLNQRTPQNKSGN